jgi:serine/threonine-protein kinase
MLRKGMFISDRYEVIDKVGSGGMSDVYKAKDHKLNRYVAVKVLKQEFSEDKNFVSKFRVEAQSAAGLSHPNIVNVFDVGEDEGIYYIVMELIEGITLKRYIDRKGQLSVKEAVSILIQIAQGIEAAHNNHIIHRDIKPQNIIISKEGKVKVTDFGIARAASTNTISSNAMGSVHYISPEQAKGGFIDEKSDIYSLGITLYEMITGRVP